MRNLKKVLALVVAVAMFASFGFVASAANYSDVASNASYADAVNLLSNLGIITGYEDGTFRPTNTVTRAEAATMIVRMLGLADDVEQGETQFTDVAADNWASGYINVAVANGIVNGMGDGTFEPNGEVTYGQIVKMIVCALGYAPVAEANGGWNGGGYILAGSKAGFTKGVAGTQNAAASRATVAQLIYNALEVDLMDQKSFSTGLAGDTYEVLEGQTILSEYLELEKVEGVVVSTFLSDSEFDVTEDATVELVITKNTAEDAYYEVGEKLSFYVADASVVTLLGYTVTAYVGENEEGDDTIFAAAEKSGKNTALVLDAELIEELGADYVEYYKSESSKSTTDAAIESVITIGKGENAVEIEYSNIVINGFQNYNEDAVAVAEEIILLDNDNDGDFEFIFATVPTDNAVEFVVSEIENDDDMWVWTDEDATADFEIDEEDETKLYTIIKDGKVATAADIAEGDVITVLDTDVTTVTVYVSSTVVEGMIDEVEDDVFVINGSEYKVSPIGAVTAEDLSAGDDGLFYMNAMGKIVAVETESSIAGADLVYVIAWDESTGDFGAKEYIVKVVTATGAIEVLTIKDKKVTIDGESDNGEDDYVAKDLYEAIVDKGVGLAKIKTTGAGEISAIYFPGFEGFVAEAEYAEENDREYNEVRGTYGIVDLTADVLVFHIDTDEIIAGEEDEADDYEDAVTVTTVGNLFEDGSSYKFVAYGEEEEVPDVLVAFDAKVALDAEAPVMVVTKVVKTVADDDNTWKITGVIAGETVSVVVDPADATTEAPVEKGNVILYSVTSGYATDVQVLFASTEDAPATVVTAGGDVVDTASDEAVSIHYGDIEEKSTKSVTIDGVKYYYADEVNVTVVDYSGRTVSIAKGSLSSVKASNDKYTRSAFVKTVAEVEDEISDIVVFVEAVEEAATETPSEAE